MTLANPDIEGAEAEQQPQSVLGLRSLSAFGFRLEDGALVVRKTGVRLQIAFPLFWEIAHWAFYLPVLAVVAAVARLRRRVPLRLWYTPDRAGPWYLLRGAALWAGYTAAGSPDQANAAFYFDDTTQGTAPAVGDLRLYNGTCTDISKSHVATVFEEVFGYPLLVDPATSIGPIVEKAEKNGVHDGALVIAPVQPRPGYVYQRLIDTTGPDGLVHDLRTPCVGGLPVVVWEKTKPTRMRFTIHNSRAVLRDPASVYSVAELALIASFTARMGLDWGGLDILRDRVDGRIYIVDVNKTDLGPVIALRWGDKLRSMRRLARALSALVEPQDHLGQAEDAQAKSKAARTDPAKPVEPKLAAVKAPILTVIAALGLTAIWMWLRPQNAALAFLGRYAEQLRSAASLHPMLGLLIFVLAYAAVVSLMLPVGLIMIFAGGYVLGAIYGAAGSMVGASLGAVISYAMGSFAPAEASNWDKRFPSLRMVRAAVVGHPFRYILSMRLIPLTPFTLVSLAAGLNRIGLVPFALGTLLGVAPECFLYSAVGSGLSQGFTMNGLVLAHPVFLVGLVASAALIVGSTFASSRNTQSH